MRIISALLLLVEESYLTEQLCLLSGKVGLDGLWHKVVKTGGV